MGDFIPKNVPEDHWIQLKPNEAYAIQSNENSPVHLKFGAGGLFVSITTTQKGQRIFNSVVIEDGRLQVLGKIDSGVPTVVGRSSEASLQLQNGIMSRKHLHVYAKGNVFFIKDLGSTNGTFCHNENFFVNVVEYLKNHSGEKASESTMSDVQEAFGADIDEIFKHYQTEIGKE